MHSTRQDTFFMPNALTVVTVGPSPRKILKKVRAVTLFTGSHVSKLCDNQVIWRGGGLKAFQASRRLIFDFSQENGLAVQAVSLLKTG